jgi:dihydrofolate reductase
MAKLSFGMMQSLDGFVAAVDGDLVMPPPGDKLFRHFVDHITRLDGIIYGRRMYEVMRYWDDDQADDQNWGARERDFAAAWRAMPKWVASRTLKAVGPNATLMEGDVVSAVRKLKADLDGEIEVAGPEIAGVLTAAGLIDEYTLFYRPFVLGGGKPFFAGARPPLRIVATGMVGDAVKVTCVPGGMIQAGAVFKENLSQLPPIDGVQRIDLIDATGAVVATIENQPGKQGSVAVYQYLQQTFGTLDAKAAEHGLAVFAEHTADARTRPGAHPNVDRLLAVVGGGETLRIEVMRG